MPLQLIELLIPKGVARDRFESGLRSAIEAAASRVVETTLARDLERFYVVVESSTPETVPAALKAADFRVEDAATVRVVGELPAAGSTAPSHLVEWDLPADLKMDQYLKRKAEKTPLYANVPEVKFLRTYVRDDMVKCVCLYEAPDEDAVRRAREAVSAPVDRLSRVAPASDDE